MTNYFFKEKSLFSTTLATSIGTGTSDTLTLASTTGLPTDTEVTLTFDRVASDGVTKTPAKTERIRGTVSGSNIINYTRNVDGQTEQAHLSGAVVECVWNGKDWNDAIDGLLVEHNQTGTHKAALVTTLKATGAVVTTGTSDVTIVTPKALADAGHVLDTDGTLAANSDSRIATQKAAKTYIDARVAADGWIAASGTWTYASATTITVPSGAASIYRKGDRIKLTQTTVKYFVITTVADTVLTVTGGSDYTVANAAITDPYYSHQANPLGYPSWFNYTPTGVSASNVTMAGRFQVIDNTCRIRFKVNFTGGITYTTAPTLPIQASALNVTQSSIDQHGTASYIDAGTAVVLNSLLPAIGAGDTVCYIVTIPAGTVISATVPITWANNDAIMVDAVYEI